VPSFQQKQINAVRCPWLRMFRWFSTVVDSEDSGLSIPHVSRGNQNYWPAFLIVFFVFLDRFRVWGMIKKLKQMKKIESGKGDQAEFCDNKNLVNTDW
jgi:hypothetical protein